MKRSNGSLGLAAFAIWVLAAFSAAAVERALGELRGALRACEFAIVGAGEGTPVYELGA